MKLFKIPKATTNGKPSNNQIIGVIDASGSMSGVWPLVAQFWNKYIPADNAYTITFDDRTHICQNNILNSEISKHGGRSTDILRAFAALEKKLETLPQDTSVTVIFISDGQDNDVRSLENRLQRLNGNPKKIYINFLCLGIEAGFPTFLSMKLREKYHTGDPTIPAVFLIEYSSEKAFLNKFESMKPYFSTSSNVTVHPPVIRYPWAEPQDSVFERVWVLTDSSMLEVGEEIIDLSKDSINLEGVVEIFKGWVQMIHLESLKPGNDMKTMASQTIKYMELLFDQVKKEKGIDIIKESAGQGDEPEGLSFHQRALRNLIKHTLSRAVWFYDDVKLLAEGKSPKELNEYDAAKRIGIGTIVGKYHQKALALKGITVDEFKVLRDEFAALARETTLTPHSSQEASVITLENQKEVFLQKDFVDGLNFCNSQFDLVESFPLIGLAIKIKRYNGSMLNPWLTQVKFIAKHHKVVDTISIVKSSNNLQLKVGEDTIENINAVLPLFTKSDDDMKGLLRSRLYHLMMTFNVMQNVDTLYEDAYLALLSNTLVYLLGEKESEWKKELLQVIENTVKLVYYDTPSFETYRENLIKDPINAINNDEEQKKYGSIDLSKAILHLFMLSSDKKLDDIKSKQIIDAIIGRFFFSLAKTQDFQISKFFKCKIVSDSNAKALDTVRENFKYCKTMGDLRRQVYAAFDKVMSTGAQYDYSWDLSELYKLDQKIKIETLEEVTQLVLGTTPTKEDYITWLGKAALSDSFPNMFNNENGQLTVDKITGTLGKKLTVDTKKGGVKQLTACKLAIDTMSQEFKEWFKKIHWEILPISKAEFNKICQDNKLNPAKMDHSDETYLVKHGCLAPQCPHYMVHNDRLHHHMDVWDHGLPWAFHKTVKAFYKLSPEEIYNKFTDGTCARHKAEFDYTKEKYQRSKEEVLAYISKLKTVYEQIL